MVFKLFFRFCSSFCNVFFLVNMQKICYTRSNKNYFIKWILIKFNKLSSICTSSFLSYPFINIILVHYHVWMKLTKWKKKLHVRDYFIASAIFLPFLGKIRHYFTHLFTILNSEMCKVPQKRPNLPTPYFPSFFLSFFLRNMWLRYNLSWYVRLHINNRKYRFKFIREYLYTCL